MADTFTPEQITQILEEFFKVVGTRKYIGERYVPIFGRKGEDSIEWDNSAPYEPLTIVLYQGDSYTSRQYVPIGVEITNQDFWVITGNYNAQVEAYHRETIAAREIADNAITTANNAQNDINTLLPKADFSAENTVKKYIDENPTRVLTFDTVADMQAATMLKSGMTCHTNGFHASGDGGAAYYTVSANGTANGMDVLACADGLYATLVVTEPYVTPEMFGAYGDGTNEDTSHIAKMFEFLQDGGVVRFCAGKTYINDADTETRIVNDNTTIIAYGATIKSVKGENKGRAFKIGGASSQNIANNIVLLGGTFDGRNNDGATDDTSHQAGSNTVLHISYMNNCIIKDCTVINAVNDGLAGSYVTNTRIENIVVKNSFEHNVYISYSDYVGMYNISSFNASLNTWSRSYECLKMRDCAHVTVDGFSHVQSANVNATRFVVMSGAFFNLSNFYGYNLNRGVLFDAANRSELSGLKMSVVIDGLTWYGDTSSGTSSFEIVNSAELSTSLLDRNMYKNINVFDASSFTFSGGTLSGCYIKGTYGNNVSSFGCDVVENVTVEDLVSYLNFNNPTILVSNFRELGDFSSNVGHAVQGGTFVNYVSDRSASSSTLKFSMRNADITFDGVYARRISFDCVVPADDTRNTINISNVKAEFGIVSINAKLCDAFIQNIGFNEVNTGIYATNADSMIKYCGVYFAKINNNGKYGTATFTKVNELT